MHCRSPSPETLSLVLNTDLTLQGDPDRSQLRGKVVIADGEYVKDVALNLLQGIGPKKRKPSPQAPAVTHPLLQNMGLDVAVSRTRPFRVDNNLAQLEISPDLHIAGTPGRARYHRKGVHRRGHRAPYSKKTVHCHGWGRGFRQSVPDRAAYPYPE